MEIIEKQVEKVKEVPADNYGYNYGRRDINGKANAGLTLGIIGTALGAWALFGGRRSASLLGGTGTGSGADANIAIATCGGSANGVNAPTAFQAWEKECEDTLALQAGIYNLAMTYQNNRFADRQQLNSEGKELLQRQLKIVRSLKSKIIQDTNREMEMFRKFREFSKAHPEVTYDEFIKANM
jgi:hypothetical protein